MSNSRNGVDRLKQLSPAALASSKNWPALAALVQHQQPNVAGPGPKAAEKLAECSHDPEAFTWLWELSSAEGRTSAMAWQAFGSLPESVVVPDAVHGSVMEFLLRSLPAAQQRQQPPQWLGAQTALLRSLDPADAFSQEAYRRVVRANEPPGAGCVSTAAQRLAASADGGDRALAVAALDRLPATMHAKVLQVLPLPYSDAEGAAVRKAVALVGQQGVDVKELAALAARLETEPLVRVLTKGLPGNRWQTLVDGGLLKHLGAARTMEFLEHPDLAEAAQVHVLAQAANQLPSAELPRVVLWAYRELGDDHEAAGAILAKLARDVEAASRAASRVSNGPEQLEVALGRLVEVVRGTDSLGPAQYLTRFLKPGNVTSRLPRNSPDEARRAGRVAGLLLSSEGGAQYAEDVNDFAATVATDGTLASFIEGLAQDLPNTPVGSRRVPLALLNMAIDDPVAIAKLDSIGRLDEAIDSALRSASPEAAAWRIVGVVSAGSSEQLSRLEDVLGWSDVPNELFLAGVAALTATPDLFASFMRTALSSIAGPQDRAIPRDQLVGVLEAAAAASAPPDPSEWDVNLSELLQRREPKVVEAAAQWLRHLDPTAELVRSVIDADDQTAHRSQPLVDLRRAYANELVARGLDRGRDIPNRIDDVELAHEADPHAARSAAFDLANEESIALRQAAAALLARGDGTPEDLERIDHLLADETNVSVREQLSSARRRISSGDVGEALHNLLAMLELPTTVDADRLVPAATERQDAFTQLADETRSRYGDGNPGPFIEKAIVLADLLVDIAILATHDATGSVPGVKPANIEPLRRNDAARPDTGHLVQQQQAVQHFGWFSTVASMRQLRAAHPTRIGSTSPIHHGDLERLMTYGNLKLAVEGWIRSMSELP